MDRQWQKSRTFWEACGHALVGIRHTFQGERNFRIQLVIYAVALLAGLLLKLSATSLAVMILAAVVILTLESINTALEALSNVVSHQYNTELRYVKDVAAGAVLLASVGAILIVLLLFIPALV